MCKLVSIHYATSATMNFKVFECSLHELFNLLKKYAAETGAALTIESVMALGRALNKNYSKLAPRVSGRVAEYKLHVATGVEHDQA